MESVCVIPGTFAEFFSTPSGISRKACTAAPNPNPVLIRVDFWPEAQGAHRKNSLNLTAPTIILADGIFQRFDYRNFDHSSSRLRIYYFAAYKVLQHMRLVGEIPHPQCKITIFSWNNRYLVKFEAGYFEQTFKIDQFDVAGDEALKKLVDSPLIESTMQRFLEMEKEWSETIQRHS